MSKNTLSYRNSGKTLHCQLIANLSKENSMYVSTAVKLGLNLEKIARKIHIKVTFKELVNTARFIYIDPILK